MPLYIPKNMAFVMLMYLIRDSAITSALMSFITIPYPNAYPWIRHIIKGMSQ